MPGSMPWANNEHDATIPFDPPRILESKRVTGVVRVPEVSTTTRPTPPCSGRTNNNNDNNNNNNNEEDSQNGTDVVVVVGNNNNKRHEDGDNGMMTTTTTTKTSSCSWMEFSRFEAAMAQCGGPPSLQRHNSLSGNILKVFSPITTKDEEKDVAAAAAADDDTTGGKGNEIFRSYWLQRKIAQNVRVGFLLVRPKDDPDSSSLEWDVACPRAENDIYPFEIVAIKTQQKSMVSRRAENRPAAEKEVEEEDHHHHDPIREKGGDGEVHSPMEVNPSSELSALQLVAANDPNGMGHVMRAMTICCDRSHVYSVTPYYGEGTLFQYVGECGRLGEPTARHFFHQILKGLKTLRDVGLCHRNLSLENILMKGSDVSITDLRYSVRLSSPFSEDDDEEGYATRWLLDPNRLPPPGGNPRYLAPEIVRSVPYDGYAADLWTAGIMLSGMLFGTETPFAWASNEDPRYHEICVKGNLRGIALKWAGQQQQSETGPGVDPVNPAHNMTAKLEHPPVSDDALDLMQGMLRAKPHERLSFMDVWEHRWMTVGESIPPKLPSRIRWEDQST